jgi:cytosine/adenosine deaminase-related metal-dependent hydrolase
MAPDVVWDGVPRERDQDLPVTTLDETFAIIERLSNDYRARTAGRIEVWPSPATSATVTAEGLRRSSGLAKRLGGSWALHLGETRTEHSLRGVSGVAYLESIGALDDRLLAAHCVHIDDNDIATLARRGVRVSTNPASNCYLASGVAPVPAMLRAGVRVGLGTDDANCNDSVNPFFDMKLLALLHRGVNEDPKIISPEKVFRMAAADGAAAVGMADRIGSIEAGKRADLITLRLREPQLTPFHWPLAALVFQAYGSEVETALVDGRVVMRDRVPVFAPDLEELAARAQAASAAVVQRAGLRPPVY